MNIRISRHESPDVNPLILVTDNQIDLDQQFQECLLRIPHIL